MIEVSHLTKHYQDIVAVEDVSFKVTKGEIVGFLGPNGAGKTTTMRILTGFIPAQSGKAVIAGFDVSEQPLEVKRRVGYLPEHPPLYLDMSAGAYLRYVARIKGVPRKKLEGEIERVATRCAITDVLGRINGNLSRGYQQRVGLAQSLLGDPEVLIFDEPTVGLDPNQIIEVRNLIKELAGDHTIILSTHILPEATMTCQRVMVIHRGRIVEDSSVEELSSKYEDASLEEIFIQLTAA